MIYLVGEVNPQMTFEVMHRLDKNPKRANFMLSSLGGSLSDGLALYDRIAVLPESIITATGVCASSALVILQAAKIRRATPTTQFMHHLVKFDDLQDSKDFKPHYDRTTHAIFRERGVSQKNYELALKLKIFSAYQAFEFGFIDMIYDGSKHERSGIS